MSLENNNIEMERAGVETEVNALISRHLDSSEKKNGFLQFLRKTGAKDALAFMLVLFKLSSFELAQAEEPAGSEVKHGHAFSGEREYVGPEVKNKTSFSISPEEKKVIKEKFSDADRINIYSILSESPEGSNRGLIKLLITYIKGDKIYPGVFNRQEHSMEKMSSSSPQESNNALITILGDNIVKDTDLVPKKVDFQSGEPRIQISNKTSQHISKGLIELLYMKKKIKEDGFYEIIEKIGSNNKLNVQLVELIYDDNGNLQGRNLVYDSGKVESVERGLETILNKK